MRTIILTVAVFCFLGSSCEDEKNGHHIVIKTGRACGWCGGSDTLTITKAVSAYDFTNPCDENKNKEREEQTAPGEWSELLGTLNWNDFKKVNVNTCALCADGCDTWITIQNGPLTHQIRFTENSVEIEHIRTFVERLKAHHEEFRQN